ncbi:MAG: signal peptidase I [candidate division Zixibacteria bacterium RBG_16_53_22]|nr:MAG: signal peptidase I [candidate division Zixibacteria bacterium RBG_16_53_22]
MALFSKKPKKIKQHRTFLEVLWDYVQSLGVALILALMIKHSVVEAYKIPSGSMERTLLIGDFLLANKFVYGMRLPIPFTDIKLPALAEPKPNDIIIFKYPGDRRQNFIKRLIAVEGQKIKVVDKQVYVDGRLVSLPPHGQYADKNQARKYFPGGQWVRTRAGEVWYTEGQRDNMPETVVPKGMLFVMGDNRDNSSDSRFWGFLDRDLVLGKAMIIHWSWQSYYREESGLRIKDPEASFPEPPEIVASNPFSIVQNLAFNIYHLPERVRWGRIGTIIK